MLVLGVPEILFGGYLSLFASLGFFVFMQGELEDELSNDIST